TLCEHDEHCFFQAEDGIRDRNVTGVQTCALPICPATGPGAPIAVVAREPGCHPLRPTGLVYRARRGQMAGQQMTPAEAMDRAVEIGRTSCRERREVTETVV